MKPPLEELACSYVLDHLAPEERAAFEAHMLGDAELTLLVRQLETALAREVSALPQHEPPLDLLARTESRLAPPLAREKPARGAGVFPHWSAMARWGIAAVIAASLLTIAAQLWRREAAGMSRPLVILVGLDAHQSQLAALPIQRRPVDSDASFIELASLAEKFWKHPATLPITISTTGGRERGYAVFDPISNQGFIAVRELPAIDADLRYHLWLVDTISGRVRDAGALPRTDSNNGLYFFSVAPDVGAKADHLDFFVTAENATSNESPQPRGKVILGDRRI